jgi:UPF0148 protein
MSSDEFDKEAEREKLREKYAKEEEDRQTTQRMSELLLQGATMTNRHCDACGDPVFRYEGQEFCPTCQAAGGGATPANGQSASAAESSEPSGSPEAEAGRAVADEERTDPVDTASQPFERQESDADATQAVETHPPTETRSVSSGGDLAGAREELGRTITRLARRAGESDAPRQAREFLEAANEAAATLETLDGR